jgi:hypothetical protein
MLEVEVLGAEHILCLADGRVATDKRRKCVARCAVDSVLSEEVEELYLRLCRRGNQCIHGFEAEVPTVARAERIGNRSSK